MWTWKSMIMHGSIGARDVRNELVKKASRENVKYAEIDINQRHFQSSTSTLCMRIQLGQKRRMKVLDKKLTKLKVT